MTAPDKLVLVAYVTDDNPPRSGTSVISTSLPIGTDLYLASAPAAPDPMREKIDALAKKIADYATAKAAARIINFIETDEAVGDAIYAMVQDALHAELTAQSETKEK